MAGLGPDGIALLLGQEASIPGLRQQGISTFLNERQRRNVAATGRVDEAQRLKEASATAIAKVQAAKTLREAKIEAARIADERKIAGKGVPQIETAEQTAQRVAQTANIRARTGQVGVVPPVSTLNQAREEQLRQEIGAFGKPKPLTAFQTNQVRQADARLDLTRNKDARGRALDVAAMERAIVVSADNTEANPDVTIDANFINTEEDKPYYWNERMSTDQFFDNLILDKVPLPFITVDGVRRQATMADMRELADKNGMTLEQVMIKTGVITGE